MCNCKCNEPSSRLIASRTGATSTEIPAFHKIYRVGRVHEQPTARFYGRFGLVVCEEPGVPEGEETVYYFPTREVAESARALYIEQMRRQPLCVEEM